MLQPHITITTLKELQVDINRFLSGQDTVSIMRRLAREYLGEDATAAEIEEYVNCRRMRVTLVADDEPTSQPYLAIGMPAGVPFNFPLEAPDPPSVPAESVQLDQATRDLPFVYDTLPARHIRLLRQAPSTSDGVPHLFIETYSLEEAPKFSALSYTWGSPTLAQMVLCNGRRKHITANLYYALGRVFCWRDSIYLWADGLCINQEDILERNQQVRLMGEIYTQAERTVAYLGEPIHDDAAEGAAAGLDEVPFALMQCLSRILEKGTSDRPDQRWNEDWEMLHIPGMDFNDMESDSMRKWLSVLALCWQPWFTRAWVLQEVALARDVMVFYGSATNTLESLAQFWALSASRDLPPALRYGLIADYKGLIENTSLLSIFTELRAAKAQELAGNDRPSGTNFVLPGRYSRSQTLLRLLKNTRRAAATDSRDKVYCLMSLATDISSLGLAPDYSSENTTALVYRYVAEAYIQSGSAVDVLYQAGLPRSAHVDGLPSWVPDWSAQARRPLDERRYCCMKDTVPHIRLSRPTGSLIVHGAVIDSLLLPSFRVSFEQRPEMGSILVRPHRTWFSEFSELGVPAHSIPYCHHGWNAAFQIIHGAERIAAALLGERYHTGEHVRHAVWRTLIADTHWWGGADGHRDKAAHDAYTRLVRHTGMHSALPTLTMESLQETWPLVAAVMGTVQGHFFSPTACGRMGLFPNEARMGDLIAVVAGSRVPFVIRPRPDAKAYTLVGPCYVHGTMHGELLRPRRQDGHPAPRDGEGRPYKVKLRPWLRSLTEKAKLRRHLDPDVCLEAEWKDLYLA